MPRGLRIIRGKAKGARLQPVPGDTTRPITDRVKEALFNILGADVLDSHWLDLFAGTGSVGLEALSNGAAFVRLVDLHRTAIRTLHANLKATRLGGGAEIRQADAFALLAQPADHQFDYVYIAPPQYRGLWKKALMLLDAHTDWLSEDAWVIVQIHPKEYEEVALRSLKAFDRRQYGSTLLIFYERSDIDGLDGA
ncbi:MAG: 16S rRNA (guanine(966)-N(2))-methyltransferase RsmD [Anaerolineae bacterium]|nr:MAG: 16S rRNA (guanine(966)-N(2))-methyltransferase RsmD [Anaerolineae bacterium]